MFRNKVMVEFHVNPKQLDIRERAHGTRVWPLTSPT